MSAVVLAEEERHPTLSAAGRERLEALAGDPDAPAWTHRAGDRLTADQVRRAERLLPVDEDWLDHHLAVARQLPFYRHFPGPLESLTDFPLISREDLLADIGGFVPFHADLDLMVHGTSSGSTGHALPIPDHLVEVARTVTFLRSLLAESGMRWEPDPVRMAIAYVVCQRQAFTYVSSLSGFDEAMMARLNLDGRVWPRTGGTGS